MRKIAALALGVVLFGVWGCSSQPKLTAQQKKQIEYLEALADQRDNEAEKAESLAKFHLDKARELRERAVDYRRKAKLVMQGQDIDEMEREVNKW